MVKLQNSNSSLPVPPAAPSLVDMYGITVRFGAVLANDQVDFSIARGEVVAILGENGAGKSTLMNVLVGLVQPQAGEIQLEGHPVTISSPVRAMQLGIGMVHQHFALIPTLTVVQNICIGLRSAGFPFPNLRRVAAEVRDLAHQYQLHVDPDARVDQLSVGEQQRVEIVKALYRGAELLILDEPTAVLTPQETEGLFAVIRRLAAQGKSVIFISHKLNEVLAISDRVIVMRQGRRVAERTTATTTTEELVQLMVGREVLLPEQPQDEPSLITHLSTPVLAIQGLRYVDERGVVALHGVDLTVEPGEIHGIAGVDGNGQNELIHLLAGLITPNAGKVIINGKDLTRAYPGQRIDAGVAHVPADRHHVGLALDMSIADNMVLATYDHPPFSYGGVLNRGAAQRFAQDLVSAYDIRCHSVQQLTGTLSGGNQQKVVLAREMSRDPLLILANQPTRGLDVGAIEYVYNQLLEARRQGSAVLLVSTEMEELLALADRISVIYAGEIMGTLPRQQATRAQLGLMMAGGRL
jgi:general nucleoside transport system ATP-binding protein